MPGCFIGAGERVLEGCFSPYGGSVACEGSPVRTARGKGRTENSGGRRRIWAYHISWLPAFLSGKGFFQHYFAKSNIKGSEVVAVSINETLFCALVQMKWCSFKDGEVNAGICSGGRLKCLLSGVTCYLLEPITSNPLTLQMAHVDCPYYRTGLKPEGSVFRCCISSKLLPDFFLHCSLFSLWLKYFFLIALLICKYTGLGTVCYI